MIAHAIWPELDIQLADLSPDQLDGLACVRCGGRDGEMVPVRLKPMPRRQLFVHVGCKAPARTGG